MIFGLTSERPPPDQTHSLTRSQFVLVHLYIYKPSRQASKQGRPHRVSPRSSFSRIRKGIDFQNKLSGGGANEAGPETAAVAWHAMLAAAAGQAGRQALCVRWYPAKQKRRSHNGNCLRLRHQQPRSDFRFSGKNLPGDLTKGTYVLRSVGNCNIFWLESEREKLSRGAVFVCVILSKHTLRWPKTVFAADGSGVERERARERDQPEKEEGHLPGFSVGFARENFFPRLFFYSGRGRIKWISFFGAHTQCLIGLRTHLTHSLSLSIPSLTACITTISHHPTPISG